MIHPRVYNSPESGWNESFLKGGHWSVGFGRLGFASDQTSQSDYDLAVATQGPDTAVGRAQWGSPFQEGSYFVMCDGSVRFVRYGIDLRNALNPQDGSATNGLD